MTKNIHSYQLHDDTDSETLAEILIIEFSNWLGTASEDLLEDGGVVEDHLSDNHGRANIPEKVWDEAWDIFNKKTVGDIALHS